jgi:hypothetical protein
VGVGWIRDSCGECESCSRGRENVCLKGYQGTYLACDNCWGKEDCRILGCFAKVTAPAPRCKSPACFACIFDRPLVGLPQDMRVNERFAFKIPDNIPNELAAPLMCAGGTLYEPVMNYVGAHDSFYIYGLCACRLARRPANSPLILRRVHRAFNTQPWFSSPLISPCEIQLASTSAFQPLPISSSVLLRRSSQA